MHAKGGCSLPKVAGWKIVEAGSDATPGWTPACSTVARYRSGHGPTNATPVFSLFVVFFVPAISLSRRFARGKPIARRIGFSFVLQKRVRV